MRISGNALIDGRLLGGVTLTLEGGVIADVEVAAGAAFDPAAAVLAPGFIDLHVHGAAGADFMDGDEEAARRICTAHARRGTTALLATTLSAEREDIVRAVDAVCRLVERPQPGQARVLGMHFEGPWLNPQRAGAQDPGALRAAEAAELEDWLERLGELAVVCTVAPEVAGVMTLIERYAERVIFSLGHTCATYEQARAALRAGARHFTHLFNAMSGLHHRDPGVVGAALADARASAELVADGIHVHPAVLGVALRTLGRRAVLVTDAMRACAMPDGVYSLYRHEVTVAGGAARLADGTLAGSVLSMDAAVRCVVERAEVPLAAALAMASEAPAHVLGLEAQYGRLAPGRRADLVVLDAAGLAVQRVLIEGREIEDREMSAWTV